ncbi:hypothetical protein HZF05_08080 [Sphingomonas sp. CGMCC 1.13654]|uniref:Uncharacterized protein n=1 Tax=Sphingomonas chungangi TaxID=2683589 RepID=A0A838L4V8_9SPHN|nr:hypothetical protein [Sphingomonas chungangi]MBA2934057.1 hypothetical protein [Sphingomonas chungangi]MVW57803.1 hypothetical protein [Sphingomonas chungangi]
MAEKRTTVKQNKSDASVTRIATIAAGAAIGSAAIAAAVLFATRKRDGEAADGPASPDRMPPETD